MRLIDLGIGVEPRVVHDAVDEVIDHGGNGIDAPKPLVEAGLRIRRFPGLTLSGHVSPPSSRGDPTRRAVTFLTAATGCAGSVDSLCRPRKVNKRTETWPAMRGGQRPYERALEDSSAGTGGPLWVGG